MDIIIKQRILGSLVLIAIAIVFVPALLSGNASVFHQSLQSNIPEKPAFVIDLSEEQKLRVASDNEKMAARMANGELTSNTETAHFPLSETLPATARNKPTEQAHTASSATASAEKVPASALVATKPIATQDMSFGPDHTPSQAGASTHATSKSKPSATSRSTTASSSTTASASKNTVTAQKIAKLSPPQTALISKDRISKVTASKASAAATNSNSTAKKPSTAASKTSATSKIQKGWIVQVASFREPANATALQQRLARHGMESSVIKNRSKNGMLYRVRLGPWDRKQTAAQQQAALEKIVNLDTLLLKLH